MSDTGVDSADREITVEWTIEWQLETNVNDDVPEMQEESA